MDNENILDLAVQAGIHNQLPLREYLARLLKDLLKEAEAFNTKRPFGFSDWGADVGYALVKAGVVSGTMRDGWTEGVDWKEVDRIMGGLIDEAFGVEA